MIQTTKDADKAKTSQRQRVDDQNDRFVSQNCHHAPRTGRTILGAIHPFSSTVSRICCVTHSPGPQKNEFGSAQGFSYGFFIPHTLDQINTAQCLWPHDLGLGIQVRRYCYRSWFLPFRAAETNTAIFSNCPASAEVFPAVIIKKLSERYCPKDTCPKDTCPKDTCPKDTRPSDCCCRCSYGS